MNRKQKSNFMDTYEVYGTEIVSFDVGKNAESTPTYI